MGQKGGQNLFEGPKGGQFFSRGKGPIKGQTIICKRCLLFGGGGVSGPKGVQFSFA